MAPALRALARNAIATTVVCMLASNFVTSAEYKRIDYPFPSDEPFDFSMCTAHENSSCRYLFLDGFTQEDMNGAYRKNPFKIVQGRSTYHNEDGDYFLYWCSSRQDWRISVTEYAESIIIGECWAWGGAKGSIRPELSEKWFEVAYEKWRKRTITATCSRTGNRTMNGRSDIWGLSGFYCLLTALPFNYFLLIQIAWHPIPFALLHGALDLSVAITAP